MELKESCRRRFAPAAAQIKKLLEDSSNEALLVGIDGRCGSGKTTLGYYLQEQLGGNLFHMDDFFLQDHQRTPERLQEPGGNVDYERFRAEVLEPIQRGEPVTYRRFSCRERRIVSEETIPWRRLNIIEGSYSLHPYFQDPYRLKIFTDIGREDQIRNIRIRNGEERLINFVEHWIPMEENYFHEYGIESGCLKIPW